MTRDFFTGSSNYQRDDRGRFNIPARMRKNRNDESYTYLTVTLGSHDNLMLFPSESFQEYVENFGSGDLSPEEQDSFYRRFLPMATEVKVDSQGRVSIPQELFDEVDIEKDVLIIGVGRWIEVWNPEAFKYYAKKQKLSYGNSVTSFSSFVRKNPNSSQEKGPAEMTD
mgnify:CR=1 FL=1